MALWILLSGITYSCLDQADRTSSGPQVETTILDSLKIKTKQVLVLFHHQHAKKSLLAKKIDSRAGIDSLFSYIGNPADDTTCNDFRLFTLFGEFDLYTDTVSHEKIATIYFVPDGDCSGYFVERRGTPVHYSLTPGERILLWKL